MAAPRRPPDPSAPAADPPGATPDVSPEGRDTAVGPPGDTPTGGEEPQAAAADGSRLLTSLDVGSELGGYRVLRELGRGGMGAVFEAEDPKLHRRVALKVMLPGLAHQETARERFLREARSAAAVEHDHVVPIYQVGEDRGIPYLVMRLLPGESLESKLAREGRLSPAAVADLGRQAALGLAAAHDRGVTHRDIKPGNLWVEPDGRVRVLDFGLARSLDAAEALTHPGCAVGTPEYMAPEQVRGKKAGPKADLFALGVVLYRAATGVSPFRRETKYGSMRAVDRETPADPRLHVPDLPDPLAEAILALLSKKIAERPPSATAVAEIFEGVAKAIRSAPPAPKPPFHGPAPSELPSLPAGPSLPAAPSLPSLIRSRAAVERPVTPAISAKSPANASPANASPENASPENAKSVERRTWIIAAAAVVALLLLAGTAALALRGLGPSAARAEDPLPAGSRWEGTFRFLPPVSFEGEASLLIESRDGPQFTGVYSSERGQYAWRVRGTAADGKLAANFVEVIKDNPAGDVVGRTTLDGTLTADTINVTWRQGDEQARITLHRTK